MLIGSLASSSLGNAYTVSDGQTRLLIECGLPINELRKRSFYSLASIDGCLVSHEHKDHCKGVDGIIRAGIEVYLSKGTRTALRLDDSIGVSTITSGCSYNIGTFVVAPFKTQHDAVEPLGFIIYSVKTKEKLLFATDTYYVRYVVPGLTHIMVECNFEQSILEKNVRDGYIDAAQKKRLQKSHFELSNVIKFLKANDLSAVEEIHLMHMSKGNSDAQKFKETIQKITGKVVLVCQE